MRGVLGQVSASAAGRILNSANPNQDKSLTDGCVRCSIDQKEHSKHDEEAQVSQWKSREPVCQKILMRQYASCPRKRRVDTKDKRLQGIAENASSAPPLDNSSAVSFPTRNKCLGTHCSLITQERQNTVLARSSRELEVEEKMEKKIGW